MKCFEAFSQENKSCDKNTCRYWINCHSSKNCTILATQKGPMTLQEIGEIFGVTRMRICQIEKKILEKVYFGLRTE